MATGVVKFLNGKGHTTVQWDTSDPDSVEAAKGELDRALAQGATAFDTTSPAGGVALGDKPLTEDVTVVPRLSGGR